MQLALRFFERIAKFVLGGTGTTRGKQYSRKAEQAEPKQLVRKGPRISVHSRLRDPNANCRQVEGIRNNTGGTRNEGNQYSEEYNEEVESTPRVYGRNNWNLNERAQPRGQTSSKQAPKAESSCSHVREEEERRGSKEAQEEPAPVRRARPVTPTRENSQGKCGKAHRYPPPNFNKYVGTTNTVNYVICFKTMMTIISHDSAVR